MARIVNLGNGYGQLQGYPSCEAPMTFPLKSSEIGRLYARGYLTTNEAIQALLDMGYSQTRAEWYVAMSSPIIEELRASLNNARTI